jgi:light-regulated signal transduction histidine kinase (bacteriophytochrome)
LSHAIDDLASEIDAKQARVVAQHLPLVWGRASLFQTMFHHLLANAIKFGGGHPPAIEISVEDRGDVWRFAVADRGVGVDARFADRIFGIFQRGHAEDDNEGSGVGLAICSLIVQRCGGRIWLDRRYADGARFLFTLPKAGPASNNGPAANPGLSFAPA